MSDEFPDEDELDNFGDEEMEVWREMEENEIAKSKSNAQSHCTQPEKLNGVRETDNKSIQKPVITNDVAVHFPLNVFNNKQVPSKACNEIAPDTSTIDDELSQPINTQTIDDILNKGKKNDKENHLEETSQPKKKRTVEEILKDVDELIGPVTFDDDYFQVPKRPRWDNPDEIIKILVQERKKESSLSELANPNKNLQMIDYKGIITNSVPTYNFVPITRPDDWKRFYIKVKYENRNPVVQKSSNSGLLSVSYSQLKAEANEILRRKEREKYHKQFECEEDQDVQVVDSELWVDKYRPKKYMQLLSDEQVNLTLLRWLKYWDKIVFDKDPPKPRKRKTNLFTYNDSDEMGEDGVIKHKIVLLSGPPGLGKTTLAHVAARHAGYNVVEFNASDDRTPDAFREALISATQMKSMFGTDQRPNCLVMDEIDGASASSIELLLKFVNGELKQKGRNNKKVKFIKCQRPVICICNEINTLSLRPLKAAALVIRVPPVNPAILTDRLMTIAAEEGLNVARHAVRQLVERSGCDIRTCLGALQYMGGVNLDENISLAMKDTKLGIFDIWKKIFQLPMKNCAPLPMPERVKEVLKSVYQGETEKLVDGIFDNYARICQDNLNVVSESLEWLQFYDSINTLVRSNQVWSIMPYTNYPFVIWHLNFAIKTVPKLNYPSAPYENSQKLTRTKNILESLQKSSGLDKVTLILDITPMLPIILNPRIKSTPTNMFRGKEKDDLKRLINIMLDYGITYVQEKQLDGKFEYKLEPNILDIGTFPNFNTRRSLAYAAIQVLIRELEEERIKRDAISFGAETLNPPTNTQSNTKSTVITGINRYEKPRLPSKVPSVPPEDEFKPVKRNCNAFFDKFKQRENQKRILETSRANEESSISLDSIRKSCVKFKFKEGYTKVRRKVYVENIL